VSNVQVTASKTSARLKAFKRAPSLGLSMWHLGSLTTNLAEKKDTNGAFCLVEGTLAPGSEPPPHVHTREDELFYVLEGEFDVYVGKKAFKVEAGECVFLPRFKPHAFVIRSPWLRVLALFSPAGLEEAFRSIDSPAQSLEVPTAPLTNSTDAGKAFHGIKQLKAEDLKQTVQLLSDYGAHFLTPDEVADQLPLYPKPLPPNPRKLVTDSNVAAPGGGWKQMRNQL
jgi:mannose-6-phosphate isomerase-like protein (cupin superfamily)